MPLFAIPLTFVLIPDKPLDNDWLVDAGEIELDTSRRSAARSFTADADVAMPGKRSTASVLDQIASGAAGAGTGSIAERVSVTLGNSSFLGGSSAKHVL